MKNIIFLLSLGFFAFCSCSSDNEVIDEEKMETVTFSVGSSKEATRAYWVNNSVYWEREDKLMVFATHHKEGSEFIRTGEYDANQTDMQFTGSTYVESSRHTHEYIFVYPYEQVRSYDGDNAVTVEIPAVQVAKQDSFDPKACIQIGSTGKLDDYVSLLNVCAFLKITVTEPCDWVKITADGTYGVGGVFQVNKEAEINPDWDHRYTTVTLENLTVNGTYLIAIGPSQNNYPEINAEVKFKNYDKTLKNHCGQISITKGMVYNLGICAVPESWRSQQ